MPYRGEIAWSGDGRSVIYGGRGRGPKAGFELRRLEVDSRSEEICAPGARAIMAPAGC